MDKKIINSKTVRNFSVLTDTGYEKIYRVHNTIPLNVINLSFSDGLSLECADTHILFCKNDSNETIEVFAKDLTVGSVVISETGTVFVTNIGHRTHSVPMFDLSVEGGKYFTNGVLSHNTTMACVYLLYEAMFPDKPGDLLVVAHKMNQAMEIIRRFKNMYYSLPNWLKAGVIKNNESSMEFDNAMRIFAEATTADAGRGKSLKIAYCVGKDTMVSIKDKVTGEIKEVSMLQLKRILQ